VSSVHAYQVTKQVNIESADVHVEGKVATIRCKVKGEVSQQTTLLRMYTVFLIMTVKYMSVFPSVCIRHNQVEAGGRTVAKSCSVIAYS